LERSVSFRSGRANLSLKISKLDLPLHGRPNLEVLRGRRWTETAGEDRRSHSLSRSCY
jgi:hypothetical protein